MADLTPEEIMCARIKDSCVTEPCENKMAEFVKILFDDPRVVDGNLTLEINILDPKDTSVERTNRTPQYSWEVKNGKIYFYCRYA